MSPSAEECRTTVEPACSSLWLKGFPMNPDAPVTRTVLFIWEKGAPVLFKLIDGPLVIVGPANVKPVAVMGLHLDRLTPAGTAFAATLADRATPGRPTALPPRLVVALR